MAFAGAGVFFSITFGVAKLIYQDRTGYRHILESSEQVDESRP